MVLAPLSSLHPWQPMQDLEPSEKASSNGRKGLGASRRGRGTPCLPLVVGSSPPTPTSRITPVRTTPLPLCLRQVQKRNESSERRQRGRKGKMARIQSTSQRAARRRRRTLGGRAPAAASCLTGGGSCGQRSTWGRQVPPLRSLARQGGTGEKQPLVGRLRGSSPAHRELQLLPGKGSA